MTDHFRADTTGAPRAAVGTARPVPGPAIPALSGLALLLLLLL